MYVNKNVFLTCALGVAFLGDILPFKRYSDCNFKVTKIGDYN